MRAYSTGQDYAVCISKSEKNCGIKYTNPPVDSSKARSVGAAFQVGCSSGGNSGGSQDSGCGEGCLTVSTGSSAPDNDWLTIAGVNSQMLTDAYIYSFVKYSSSFLHSLV